MVGWPVRIVAVVTTTQNVTIAPSVVVIGDRTDNGVRPTVTIIPLVPEIPIMTTTADTAAEAARAAAAAAAEARHAEAARAPVYNRVTCPACSHTFDCDDNDYCPECGCNWRRTA
jgi:hypothetical protein